MEMRGNISGSLSARLTSGLFVGVMKYRHERQNVIKGNIFGAMALVIAVSLALGVFAYLLGNFAFGVARPEIILVALIAGLLSNLIEVPLTIITTLWLFRHGHDPSNIMGPYVTTIGDVISILSLLIAITVVG
jgi:mgtE-like transporter